MAEQKITFFNEDDEEVEFFIVEQTRIAGVNYLLVSDSEDDDAEALILKEKGDADDDDALYEIVEDDDELEAVSRVFGDMLEDLDIEIK